MVDRYTKIILTIIALAMVALTIRPIINVHPAGAQGLACGQMANPCEVRVTNFPWQPSPAAIQPVLVVQDPKRPIPVRIVPSDEEKKDRR